MFNEVRDPWYWRPNWREGRSFYSWTITFADRPEIAALHASYAELLAGLPDLTPVPLEWLHLSLQGVGFADRVPDADLADIVDATRHRLIRVESFPVTVGPAVLAAGLIQLPVRPIEPLQHLRDLARAAITDVWGDDAVPELPDLDPHLPLAHPNHPTPTPATTALPTHNTHYTALSITTLTLQTQTRTRTDHLYNWTPALTLALA
jgi:hypothetical protein